MADETIVMESVNATSTSGGYMDEFFREIEEINKKIETIEKGVESVKKLNSRVLASTANDSGRI
jgi:t-SNARE complex subunit (syntaxin)